MPRCQESLSGKMDSTETEVIRVGVCLTKSKKLKLKLPESIIHLCEENSMKVIEIDMEKSLESQGPFDVIIHKILEFHNEDMQRGKEYFNKFQTYFSIHKNVKLIDPIPTGTRLSNRLESLEIMKRCEFKNEHIGKSVFVPTFCLVDDGTTVTKQLLESNEIKFPFVAKHFMASSFGKEVHDMSIFFHERNLTDVKPPCVLQQFHNHDGIMLKIYVLGDNYYLLKRPSIRNLDAGNHDKIQFHSSNISKRGKSSTLHDPKIIESNTWNGNDPSLIEKEIVTELLQRLRAELSFHLLGIDVLTDTETGNYGIIDINYFPGYDGVKEKFPADLIQLLVKISSPGGEN